MINNLKQLKKRDWFLVILAIVLIGFQVYLDLSIPEYMSSITELIQVSGNQLSQIKEIGVDMLLASFGSVALSIIVGFIAATVSSSLGNSLRENIFTKVNDLSISELNNFSVPSLITRTTTDASQIQQFVAVGLQIIVKAPILAVASVTRIIGKSWQWSALVAGGILFLIVIIGIIIIFAVPKFNMVQKLTDNINRIMRENLTGIEVVRAYNAESYQEDKFAEASNNLSSNNLFGTRVTGLLQPSLNFTMSMLSIGIYWIGAYLISSVSGPEQVLLFSDMVVYSAYALQVIASFMLLSILLVIYPRVKVSANRINDVLDTEVSVIEGTQDIYDTDLKGTLSFKDITFTYPDAQQPALKNINFEVKQGETIAFIGATGSGKTTLINLVPRLHDVTTGEVLLNGINVKDYTYDSLYDKLGYVSQKAVLFSGDIKSNIDFGRKRHETMSDDDIKKALEISQGSEFVYNKEEGIQGHVAQLGTNFSGGQKQRLSIARAVARDPEILIFDDSFSALDYQTDKKLRTELNTHAKDTTKLIVAQRIGTIMDADQIIVLDNGDMVGKGTHQELMKTCLVYQDIAKSQLSEEELNNE